MNGAAKALWKLRDLIWQWDVGHKITDSVGEQTD